MVDCEKQNYAPEGEPLHQIVDEFADHQDIWFRVEDILLLLPFNFYLVMFKDYLIAFDKMLKNGYSPDDLVEGPQQWFGAVCTKKYEDRGDFVWRCHPQNK